MKKLLTSLAVVLVVSGGGLAHAATLIADAYNVTGSGSGFALGSGASSINPPTTRLTGSLAPGLRYINTGTKATTAYTITANKLQVASAVNPGRFVLSANGTTPFDFGPALGVSGAAPGNPVGYDLLISMNNGSDGTQRFFVCLAGTSFAKETPPPGRLESSFIGLTQPIIFTPSRSALIPRLRDWPAIWTSRFTRWRQTLSEPKWPF